MNHLKSQLRHTCIARSLTALVLAAACGASAAFGGNGGSGSPIVGDALAAEGTKLPAPTVTQTMITNHVDTPPNGTDD